MDKDHALSLLKEILLSEDRVKIDALQSEFEALKLSIQDKEQLIATLDPVLARLLSQKIKESKDEMAEALAPVMGTAIQKQISEAKETIIDALYPVIGQTIRKAVAEAMKNLARSVNNQIDRAFSFQLLSKKIKARMSGISTGEMVLNEALPFSVLDVFYIHKDSGVLLAQASSGHGQAKKELLSGMLTAIRSFSKSAFESDSDQNLSIIEYDDLHIHLEEGRYAYIAAVTSGIATAAFNSKLHELENHCHQNFSENLRDFSGDIEPFNPAEQLMRDNLLLFNQATEPDHSSVPLGRYIFYTLILALICISIWIFYPGNQSSEIIKTEKKNVVSNQVVELSTLKSVLIQDQTPQLPIDQVRFIARDSLLFLEGSVPDEASAIQIGKAVARHTNYAVIIDRLTRTEDIKRYLLTRHIFFEKGSPTISRSNQSQLTELGAYLKLHFFSKLILLGYGDPSGGTEINKKISLQRAESVRDYLLNCGIDAVKIEVRGMGIVRDVSVTDPATNRRVDFILE